MAATQVEAAQTANRSEPSSANGVGRRRCLISVAIVGVFIAAGALGFWLYSRRYESTEDAQAAGHLNGITARVGLAHRNYLVAHTTPGASAYEAMREGLSQGLEAQGASSVEAARQANGLISGMLQSQATTRAYVDVISILALLVLSLTPFVFIMKTSRPGKSEQPALR